MEYISVYNIILSAKMASSTASASVLTGQYSASTFTRTTAANSAFDSYSLRSLLSIISPSLPLSSSSSSSSVLVHLNPFPCQLSVRVTSQKKVPDNVKDCARRGSGPPYVFGGGGRGPWLFKGLGFQLNAAGDHGTAQESLLGGEKSFSVLGRGALAHHL